MKKFDNKYDDIISVENLLLSWQEFLVGKKKKKDVYKFQLRLMDNVFDLHNDLKGKTYKHGNYIAFKINDPKPRDIHKASVRDRLLHHAIYRILYPYFDKKFIYDSYSCRLGKGTHKAINRFRYFSRIVSKNNTKTCWVLKCDIRKFFANIDHDILKEVLKRYIKEENILWLLDRIINSFSTNIYFCHSVDMPRGLPLGNLTSQLLVNIYMNEFDQFVKHKLKVKYYIRYADDFVIFSQDKKYLEDVLRQMKEFLKNNLKLNLHPDKVFIKTIYSSIDFLGWIHFPQHRVLRTSTKRRMFRNLEHSNKKETIISYVGLLKYGNTFKLREKAIKSSSFLKRYILL